MSDVVIFFASTPDVSIHQRIIKDRNQTAVARGFTWSDLRIFRSYANGKHVLILTDRQRELLRNLTNDRFCDNVCGQIIAEACGRIKLIKWDCKNKPVKKFLDQFYSIRSVEGRQSDFHYRSLRDGNFVVAVNWNADDQYPQLYKEEWWDGITGVYIHYDSDDRPRYAVKEWRYFLYDDSGVEREITRRVIWFPDHVEKWETSSPENYQSWVPAPHDDDVVDGVTMWPMPWLDNDGEPMGIPFIHFPNVGRTYGNYGVSELDGGIIGFQDQLNDAQYNITLTARLTGAQQYWGTGIKLRKKDGSQESIPIRVDAGMFHTSENEKSQFGVLPAGSIDQQINGYMLKLKRVAQITQTPLHAITGGDWPSGDALLRSELPAVYKANKQIGQYTTCWVDVATFALKIWNKYRPDETISYDIEDGIIEADFEDPEKRDIVSRSIVVHNAVGFISIREALRILGNSDERAEQIYQEMLEEQEKSADMMASSVLGRNAPGVGAKGPPENVPGDGGAAGGGNNKPGASAE